MRTLLASSTVLLTILLSFVFGIAFGYIVIQAILRAITHKPQATEAAVAPATVIISER